MELLLNENTALQEKKQKKQKSSLILLIGNVYSFVEQHSKWCVAFSLSQSMQN